MSKKKINNLIKKIFLLNANELQKLNKKNLIIKKLQNYDSLRFMNFLSTIEEKYKIDITPKSFKMFSDTQNIYKFLDKIKKIK